jgi:hypothetical protein
VLLAVALWTHPVTVAVAPVAPALILWKRRDRAWLWLPLALVALNVMHLGWALASGDGRNASVADASTSAVLDSFVSATKVMLWEGPVSAATSLTLLELLIGLGVGLVVWWLARDEAGDDTRWPVPALGFAIAVLAFAPFTASSVRGTTQRTLLLAAGGVALVLVWVMGRTPRPIRFVLLVGIVALCSSHLVANRAQWAEKSVAQQELLAFVAERVPAPNPQSGFVIWFTDQAARAKVLGLANRDHALTYALWYLYDERTLSGVSVQRLKDAFVMEGTDLVLTSALGSEDEEYEVPSSDVYLFAWGSDAAEGPFSELPARSLREWGGDRALAVPVGDRPIGRVCSMFRSAARPAVCDEPGSR